jgi:hypothetical protein
MIVGPESRGHLEGPPEVLAALASAGILTIADVLTRSEAVRDLRDRSNHVLYVGGLAIHVKRGKGWGESREAAAIDALARVGVPVARVAFHGRDRRHGHVVGTFDLAPARPLDDLLRDGALSPVAIDAAFHALAEAAAALHGAGLHHRDLYLNHVFVDPAAARPSVTLIDVERVRRHHGLLGHAVVKDLAAVQASIPPGARSCVAQTRFLVHYLRARRFPVRMLLGPLLRRVVAKADSIRSHVPRTPVGEAARPR